LFRDDLVDFWGSDRDVMVLDVEPGEEQHVGILEPNMRSGPRGGWTTLLAAIVLVVVFVASGGVMAPTRSGQTTDGTAHRRPDRGDAVGVASDRRPT
jgi:hypothetical protein